MICFEMLTGRLAFEGDGVDVARANIHTPTPAMGVRVPSIDVDPLLEAFTRKLLMKSPDERPASAAAARKLLDLIERDRSAAERALGLPPSPELVVQPRPVPDAVTKWGIAPLARPQPALASDTPSRDGPSDTPGDSRDLAPRDGTEDRHVARRSRGWLVLGGVAVLVFAVAVGLAVHAHVAAADPPAAELALEVPPIDQTPARPRPIAPAHVVATEPPAPAKRVAATSPARPAVRRPPSARAATTQDVVNLYTTVGRELASLDDRTRPPDLVARYRYIRLHDAIATADTRRDAFQQLGELQRALAKAR